jgi:hypothetical protein
MVKTQEKQDQPGVNTAEEKTDITALMPENLVFSKEELCILLKGLITVYSQEQAFELFAKLLESTEKLEKE